MKANFYAIYFIIYFLAICVQFTTSYYTSHTAVCFVITRPEQTIFEFVGELALDGLKYGLEVFIMIDDDQFAIPTSWIPLYVQTLHISNETCFQNGYRRTTFVYTWPLEITAWDKTLFYFCELNRKHSFLWIIEADVFISSVQAFRAVHQLYSPISDLIVQQVIPNIIGDTSVWSHYSVAIGRLLPPWYRSMANILGLSRHLLNTIAEFIHWRGYNAFHEFSVQTLSLNLNMIVVSPTEFDTLFWRKDHTWNAVQQMPNNFFHPVKNKALHKLWHERIANTSQNHKNTTDWFQIKSLCNNSLDLNKLIVEFEQVKIQFTPNERRSLRQHFVSLAKECDKLRDFKTATTITEKLANSAYKLPYPPSFQTITKSSVYRSIEKALVRNKQNISRLPKNSSLIRQLRNEADNLTLLLTYEIRKEMRYPHNEDYKNRLWINSYRMLFRNSKEIRRKKQPQSIYRIKQIRQTSTSENIYLVFFVYMICLLILFQFYQLLKTT